LGFTKFPDKKEYSCKETVAAPVQIGHRMEVEVREGVSQRKAFPFSKTNLIQSNK
jgi:hypothetical protein